MPRQRLSMSAETAESSDQAREELRDLAQQQGALRRMATLVAQGAGPEVLFDAIAEEASRILGVDAISMIEYDAGTPGFTQVLATHGLRDLGHTAGPRALDSLPLGKLIVTTGRPARIDDWTKVPGPVAVRHQAEGFGQAVGAPILINGSIWGYIGAYAEAGEILPPGCEVRLADFTHLMGTAISNAQAREELRNLAEQRGALRRIATLVAEGAEPKAVFTAVAVEAARILGVGAVALLSYDPNSGLFTKIFGTHRDRAAAPDGATCLVEECPYGELVLATGRPARVDDWTDAPGPIAAAYRELGYGQAVAAPIIIDGSIWGCIGAYGEAGEILPAGYETRLADFTHLIAAAISNVQTRRARDELRSLAESQGALRRVATLVAEGAGPEVLFGAIAKEASRILGVGAISLIEYNADTQKLLPKATTLGPRAAIPIGGQGSFVSSPLGGLILATGHPARIEDWTHLPGPVAARHRAEGFGQAVGAPILVNGSIWGYIGAYGEAGETLPADCETRLADFTHLMATAISNVQARDELHSLAESQGALRRIATLVAEGAEPKAVFTAVAVEAAQILGVGAVSLINYDVDTETFTKIFGTHGERSPVPDGITWPVEECPEGALAVSTGRPARVDDWTGIPGSPAAKHREHGFGQAVAAPVIIDGSVWGCIAAYGEADEILPPACETRLADYTSLMATALSNAKVRDELRELAKQQGAALRRVATLVAQQASLPAIFNAVAGEASRALGVPRVDVGRCHEDGSMTLLGSAGRPARSDDHAFSESAKFVAAKVLETRRAARIDDRTTLPIADAQTVRQEGSGSVVGAPILVEGALWGVIVVLADGLLHEDTETRLADFTHLVASSISNVHARNNLIASRARIVTASDETRRRIERNLHDGIQQRVVSLALSVRAVRMRFPLPPEVQAGLGDVARDLEGVLEEIRVFSQGLHPALLARSGLGPSLRALARRSPIPVTLEVTGDPRFPEPIETAVYYVVSEALANAAKYSQAAEVSVSVFSDSTVVRTTVSDDGAGGAALGRGSGLIGLIDRVEALGGRFTLESPAGRGTTISIELPLPSHTADK
jgi:signal transduction histidine kinase